MILVNVQGVVKHYGPEPVLDGVSFEIRPGQRWGLVGPNGAGKTTLMKIVSGAIEPDRGTAERHSEATIGYLQQHPEFPPERTVWEEARSALDHLFEIAREAEQLAEAMSRATDPAEQVRLGKRFDVVQHELQTRDVYRAESRIEQILDGLGFSHESWTRPVAKLSGGQQNRLLLAKLLLEDPDLMLLDEPSNHLDIDATEWLENFLLESGRAILVVSHDRYFLDRVTEGTLELVRGKVDSYPGNFTKYKKLRAERIEVQRRTYEKQQEEIARMEEFIRKNFAGQKSAQAEDRRKKLERIERVEPPREIDVPPMGFPPATRTGDIVLRAEKLAKGFDRPLFENLSFDVLRGEKWGIMGPNGTGKTTLLKCLVGMLAPNAGTARWGTGVKVGYFDQMLSDLDPDVEAIEAVRPSHKEFIEQQRRDILARFGITGDMVFQKIGSLSGGERNRTALARLAASDPNVLVLDEPTNHLDLWAREALEKALLDFEGTVIFVSHDRYFLNQVATKMLIVEPKRFRVLDGNYDTYLHMAKSGLATEARGLTVDSMKGAANGASDAPAAENTSKRAEKERRKRKYPYRKAHDLEKDIAAAEARIELLHQMMGDPAVLRDGARVKEVHAELSALEEQLPQLYEHLEEAIELNG